MPSLGNVVKALFISGALAMIAFGVVPLAESPTPPDAKDAGGVAALSDLAPPGGRPPTASAADDLDPAIFGAAKSPQTFANLDTSLEAVADSVPGGKSAILDAIADAPLVEGDSVAVSVYAASDVSHARDFLESRGVSIDYAGGDWLEAYVPANLLGALSGQPDVIRVARVIPAAASQAATLCAANQIGGVSADRFVSGSWVDGCDSMDRANSRAQFFTFSIAPSTRAHLRIDLISEDADAFLYLRDGTGTSGTALASSDNISASNGNSRITVELLEGAYTLEATTAAANQTGDFAISFDYADGTACAVTPVTAGEANAAAGTWAAGCESAVRDGSHSLFYSFTVEDTARADSNVEPGGNYLIKLETAAANVDPYLILRDGGKTLGAAFLEDDNSGATAGWTPTPPAPAVAANAVNAQIWSHLPSGDYTIEATTAAAAQTGAFTLTVLPMNELEQNALGPFGAEGTIRGVANDGFADASDRHSDHYSKFYTFTVLSAGTLVLETDSDYDGDSHSIFLGNGLRDNSPVVPTTTPPRPRLKRT